MTQIIVAPWSEYSPRLLAIRYTVFVDEQKIPADLEQDEWDAKAHHILLQYNGVDIGTARLLPTAYIGRVAILKEYRHKKFGTLIMENLIAEAKRREMPQLYLSSQVQVLDFYKKLGFQEISEVYSEVDIPHVKMMLHLN